MDYETLSNCFVACFEHYKKPEKRTFVIHDLENNFDVFVNFLEHNKEFKEWHVSFNGLGFDAQITEAILRNKFYLKGLSGCTIAQYIYNKAQDVIGRAQRKEWQEFPEWKLSIAQVDLFSLMHWSNPAKMTSLKWLQCNMDWHNVLEMPIHHTAKITTRQEIDMIIEYCQNDVSSTKRAMELVREQITIRGQLTKEYGINLYNASEPRMAKELFLHFLSQQTNLDKQELKQMRTNRSSIDVAKILVPYINFERQEFKMLHNNFQKLIINGDTLRGAFKYNVKYKGLTLSYGVGGLHGDSGSGIHEAKNGMIIMTSDVKSYYPNLAISNKLSPAHLNQEAFCSRYKWFYTERTKYDKKNPINYVYKILLNSVFGLSIEKNSMLSDPQVGVSITINGQLLLTMLLEMICENIPDAKPLVANTDGIEIMLPEEYKNKYMEICKQWETLTQLELEHDQFEKLCSYDCNNFIGKYINGKTKCKGRFEFEAHDKYDANILHKNKSFLIVPKAIFNYFIHGTDPEEYLKTNKNIFDYCGFVRAKGKFVLTKFIVSATGVKTEELQKTLRYFISKDGNKIMKIDNSGSKKREINIEAGKHLCTELNKYDEKIPFEDYNIDFSYYLKEIKKEIQTLIPNKDQQKLELFD